jgi:hypothetical protein
VTLINLSPRIARSPDAPGVMAHDLESLGQPGGGVGPRRALTGGLGSRALQWSSSAVAWISAPGSMPAAGPVPLADGGFLGGGDGQPLDAWSDSDVGRQ